MKFFGIFKPISIGIIWALFGFLSISCAENRSYPADPQSL